MPPQLTPPDSLGTIIDNLRRSPGRFWRSLWRHPSTESARGRSEAILLSLFLHFHSARVHRYTLKPSFTMGLGVATLTFLLLLIGTGLFLMIYYDPSTQGAYQSTKDIHFVVPAGRSVRNLHRWAAHLMVVAVFLHMARTFYTGSYRKPREFNWVVGLTLLVLTLSLSFTGYLLPWDQLAYWAVTIGTNIGSSPTELTDALGITKYFDPGQVMRRLLLGADEVGASALVRFYFLHCYLLPGILLAFLAVHFWRIRKDGGLAIPDDITDQELRNIPKDQPENLPSTESTSKTYGLMAVVRGSRGAVQLEADNTVSTWPHALRAELAVVMFCLSLSLLCAYLWDSPMKEPANPLVPENPAKAPWYFLGLQELVGYSAFVGGAVIPAIAMLGLGLIPYLDRRPGISGRWLEAGAGWKVTLWSVLISAVTVFGTLAFTVRFGWIRNWYPKVHQIVIMLINPGTLLVLAFATLSLVVLRRTGSTRMAAISLFTAFLVGFTILTYFATFHRGPNWDFYWTRDSWPEH